MNLKLGIVGVGRWGVNIVRTINNLPGCRILRAARVQEQYREELPEDCLTSSDWCEVINANDIDALIISSPPHSHVPIASAAIQNGIPVFVEKPLALSLKDAVKLRNIAWRNRGLVLVGHVHLFHPAFVELCHRVETEGGLKRMESTGGNRGPMREDVSVLWDWGPHDIAMCVKMAGSPPEAVLAVKSETRTIDGKMGEKISISLNFPGGIRADISIGNTFDEKIRLFHAETSNCKYTYDGVGKHDLLCDDHAGNLVPIPVDDEKPLKLEMETFCNHVRSGQKNFNELDFAIEVIRTLEMCQMALDHGYQES